MRSAAIAAAVLGLVLALGTGCVRNVHHHHHDEVTLEHEHDDAAIVILHEKPRPKRHCWRHRRHWHCHR